MNEYCVTMKSDFRHRNGTSQGVVCGADMLSF
jgi:hypothetical protein